jgi:hypothetical protein
MWRIFMIQRVAVVILFGVGIAGGQERFDTGGTPNGRLWRDATKNVKAAYIVGFWDGAGNAIAAIVIRAPNAV